MQRTPRCRPHDTPGRKRRRRGAGDPPAAHHRPAASARDAQAAASLRPRSWRAGSISAGARPEARVWTGPLRAAGVAEAVATHRLLDRLIRGRVWIGVIAFALIGIVTMQLVLLKLNAGIGRSLVREALLQRENATLSAENSEEAAGEQIEAQAARDGMELIPAGALRFLTAHASSDVGKAAAALSAAAATSTTGSSATSGTSTTAQTEAGAETTSGTAGSGEATAASSTDTAAATGTSAESEAAATGAPPAGTTTPEATAQADSTPEATAPASTGTGTSSGTTAPESGASAAGGSGETAKPGSGATTATGGGTPGASGWPSSRAGSARSSGCSSCCSCSRRGARCIWGRSHSGTLRKAARAQQLTAETRAGSAWHDHRPQRDRPRRLRARAGHLGDAVSGQGTARGLAEAGAAARGQPGDAAERPERAHRLRVPRACGSCQGARRPCWG